MEGPNERKTNNRLIICPDCGAQISKIAETCPHCGRPMASRRSNRAKRSEPQQAKSGDAGVFGIIIAIVIGGIILWRIMSPYTMPVSLQKTFGQIEAIVEGKDSYTIFNWEKLFDGK